MTTQNGRGRLDSGSGVERATEIEFRQGGFRIVARNCAVNHTYGYKVRGEACLSHWCGKR